ncbi:MAG: dTMP kinase [Rikenellaceae bacterium]|nr:dTMP kinase [Rikenellaceae bacterium]MCL2692888.1 dTMP kinase [Rikenellaceae bacterium]
MPFIVIEGIDGAGKSTQVKMLVRWLEEQGRAVEFLHFPRFDAPVYGDLIARFLRGELGRVGYADPRLVALLFAGDRADAAPMIRAWLDEGRWIVMDRYVYSNVAYQCAKLSDTGAREELRDWILNLEFEHNRLPRPDLSLLLDVPWEFTERRLRSKRTGCDRDYLGGGADIHEASLDLQRRVREMYLSCVADDGLQRIDCSNGKGGMDTPENIFQRIVERFF